MNELFDRITKKTIISSCCNLGSLKKTGTTFANAERMEKHDNFKGDKIVSFLEQKFCAEEDARKLHLVEIG